MPTQSPLSADDPRMVAWERFKTSEEFVNTRKWALHEEHVEGSLWAAFLVGWGAALQLAMTPTVELAEATLPRTATNGGCVATRFPPPESDGTPEAECGREAVATVPLPSDKVRMCSRCARQSSTNGYEVSYDKPRAILDDWKAINPEEERTYEIKEIAPLGGEIHLRSNKNSAWANGTTFEDALNAVLYKWGQDVE